jgi:hypothetical protein
MQDTAWLKETCQWVARVANLFLECTCVFLVLQYVQK